MCDKIRNSDAINKLNHKIISLTYEAEPEREREKKKIEREGE